jgi:hypothetical protein
MKTHTLGWNTREPCSSCPYRKDVPPETWAPAEFENLLAQDSSQFGALFGCHATRKTVPQVCGGWLLDQKRRGLPCLSLRLAMISKPEAVAALEGVSDGGHTLYESIEEMCITNGVEP